MITTNELQIFNNSEFGEIRTLEENGKTLFVARDIAIALGYSNPSKAISNHCKGVTKRDTPTSGGNQSMSYILEGDLYRLIVCSKLPNAQKFESWVFDDVLPSIRKHGMYAVDELVNNPDLLIKVATELKEERAKNKKLSDEVNVKTQLIGELKPKADYTDKILKSKDLVTITQIAKDYGMSGMEMNRLLNKLGVQYKQSGQWLLYSDYQCKGYTMSETVPITYNDGTTGTKMNTKWTQKGRLFLYEKLKKNNVYPTMESEE